MLSALLETLVFEGNIEEFLYRELFDAGMKSG
jgi:hypothetical protein